MDALSLPLLLALGGAATVFFGGLIVYLESLIENEA